MEDFRDIAAIELALATMAEPPLPAPHNEVNCRRCQDTGWITHGDGHRTVCPDCGKGSSSYGGPLDTWRDAKNLIQKGNELADRGTAILDQAERDGKLTVDIRLRAPTVSQKLALGTCCPPVQPSESTAQAQQAASACRRMVWRPKLLARWRAR